ncbi:MAG: hypothetical protein JO353_12345 [Phycisphaerae bacterium]|nr:hypothetical protein [Phycisphaerae bacterium]
MALAIAVALIPLAVVAMTATAMVIAADARRTHQRMIDAQLDQLLLAGCLQGEAGVQPALPTELAAEGGTISISHDGGNVLVVSRFAGSERRASINPSAAAK